MNTSYKAMLLMSAVAALTACGQSQSANDQNTPGAASDANIASSQADASSLFADTEQKMSQAMMAAVGTDVGDNWAKKMVAHHQGAIDMSRVILQHSPTPDVAQMARDGIKKQQMDIDDIKKLLKNGATDQNSAELYKPAMMDMQQKMQVVTGSDASQVFLRKMLEHHKGAVAMSDVALKNGVSGPLKAQIQKTRDENRKDAAMVEAMLAGKPMHEAMKSSGAMSAEDMAKMPKPTEMMRADERMGHDMNAMGNMDMNHM